MKKNLLRNKKAVSSIFIALYITMIGIILGTALFSSLQISATSNIERIGIEQEKEQETILLQIGSISIIEEPEDAFIENIRLNNTGTITLRIRGIYIDSNLIMDPSIYQNTYINPQESLELEIYGNGIQVSFTDNKFSTLSITTERGTKYSDIIYNLFSNPSGEGDNTVYGPLRLLFEEFHWKPFVDQFDSNYLSSNWNGGWKVPDSTNIIWRVRIQNVGNMVINLRNGNATCLTLISNEGGGRWTYYIDPKYSDMNIQPKEYGTIYFAWKNPSPYSQQSPKPTDALSTNDLRAFISFLVFEGKYGQTLIGETIPFEAVLVYDYK